MAKKEVTYELNLIPKPFAYQPAPGYFTINKDTLLIVDPKRNELAEWFQSVFAKAFGHTLYIHFNKPGYNNILFEENPTLDLEGYVIECRPDCLKISAGGEPGYFYAIQTVRQILKLDTRLYEDKLRFPCMFLQDLPKYRYRGLMLDTVRHFYDRTDIKRYLELMSMFKFNVFHWHLSDDQGFRYQIDKYPFVNLTSSERARDCVGRVGSVGHYVDRTYKGYYTKEDVREVLSYAKERYITVIPEIDVPGHVQALIAAYPELSCDAQRVPVMTEYSAVAKTLCVGKGIVFEFVRDILNELFETFDGPYIHIGGHATPVDAWSKCPHCRELMEREGMTSLHELHAYFLNRVAEYCKSRGKTVIGWNDGLYGAVDPDIISQVWNTDDAHLTEASRRLETVGGKFILSDARAFNCDYPYAKTSLSDTYFYSIPERLMSNKAQKAIMGIEAKLFTEYVPDREKADMNLFPRLPAVAEQCWTRRSYPAENKGCIFKRKRLKRARFDRFLSRIYPFFKI